MMKRMMMPQLEELIAQLGDRDGLVRQQARITLVRIGEPAVALLIQTLEEHIGHTHWEAAKALSQIGSPKAALALVEALEDDEFSIRWLAAEGLIAIGKDSLKPLLEALLNNPQSTLLREGAHHVLHDLTHRMMLKKALRERLEPVLAALTSAEPAATVPAAVAKVLTIFPT